MKLEPLGSRLLVEKIKDSGLVKTESGILLGEERAPQSIKVTVAAIGDGCKRKWAIGQTILVSQFAPTECRLNISEQTLIVPEDDVLAVAVPEKSA